MEFSDEIPAEARGYPPLIGIFLLFISPINSTGITPPSFYLLVCLLFVCFFSSPLHSPHIHSSLSHSPRSHILPPSLQTLLIFVFSFILLLHPPSGLIMLFTSSLPSFPFSSRVLIISPLLIIPHLPNTHSSLL